MNIWLDELRFAGKVAILTARKLIATYVSFVPNSSGSISCARRNEGLRYPTNKIIGFEALNSSVCNDAASTYLSSLLMKSHRLRLLTLQRRVVVTIGSNAHVRREDLMPPCVCVSQEFLQRALGNCFKSCGERMSRCAQHSSKQVTRRNRRADDVLLPAHLRTKDLA